MSMTKVLIITGAFFVASSALAALPAPDDLPKDGDCPANYAAHDKLCKPTAQAKFAFIKSEHCPDAYEEQGNYCVATAAAKLAIRRAAMSCPSGFASIGNYCVSDK